MAIGKVILDGSTLIDATPATASASDITAPKTAMLSNGVVTTGTNAPVVESDVNFIDYDGTLVASRTKAQINAMESDSELPANPTHEGLTAQGWNWTVAQLKAQLTAMPDQKIWVGQMYVTTSGDTEIDVIMPEGRLSPIMTICVNGEVSIDWGDGTTPSTVTGTSVTTRLDAPHTYASAGSYTIKISSVSGTYYKFFGGSAYTLLRKNTTTDENLVYANCIQHIRLGSGITSIGGDAFWYCKYLTSITIPSSVTSIEIGAFQYCNALASVTIPSGVTSIVDSAFFGCHSLASITIPSSVTSIDNYAFNYCYSLASVTIPSGVTSIGNTVFQYCYSLTSITIPSGVTSIGNSAFGYCYSLASITIPSGVTSIGDYVFANCSSLASITIPSSVTSIGRFAFQNCDSLTSVTIPSGVTSIGNIAFFGCSSLTNITIPDSVTSIGTQAFQNCYGIAEYHFQRTTPPTLSNTNTFTNIVSDCVMYVPRSENQTVLNAYKTASNWSTYASYMQEEPAS